MDGTTIAQEVLAYLAVEGIELSEDIGKAEAVLQAQVRRIGARALELHLQGRKLGYEGSSRACSCKQNQRFVGHRSKTVATLLGPVILQRAYYHCSDCGASSLPYDERVGLGGGEVSPGLAKAATLLAVQAPFESASRMLHNLTGQSLSPKTVERLTHQVGSVASSHEEALAQKMERWESPAAEVQPERLYVAVDGAMVHERDGWHEVKTAVCYWEDETGERQARYGVRFEEAASFVAFVWSLACRCGLNVAKEVVLLGDGARWIWDRIGGLLPEATQIVDWYHAMEHVWDCGRGLYGEGSEQTTAWVKQIETLLWDGHVREILRQLESQRCQARAPAQRQALDGLVTYLRNQDDRLAYARFRARGLDIGSGRVEAACKNVVGARMKRSGMRWTRHGAQTTLSLRVFWLNGTWDALWSSHPLAA